ncbi:hypothetical protein KOW79_005988 [Hemibagrus wyckioides]|uniref:Uncharacterized protein n=1 Tax=Hemibagrus wyckioides TaxID=337641 RepID=A0A9D3SM30_9TELE|nr:hypothetical protein KOW79_005988 [Hemibagrus wyckioides]
MSLRGLDQSRRVFVAASDSAVNTDSAVRLISLSSCGAATLGPRCCDVNVKSTEMTRNSVLLLFNNASIWAEIVLFLTCIARWLEQKK